MRLFFAKQYLHPHGVCALTRNTAVGDVPVEEEDRDVTEGDPGLQLSSRRRKLGCQVEWYLINKFSKGNEELEPTCY